MRIYNKLENGDGDIVFASRYGENCGSEDDTLITSLGNFFFTKLGRFLFGLEITDILYTYVIGKTLEVRNLNLKKKTFVYVLNYLNKRANFKIKTSNSYERARISGKKKK